MAFLHLRFRFLTVSANVLAVATLLGSLTFALGVRAEPENSFPPSPLELTEPDPLIPEAVWEGATELKPEERRQLDRALDTLNARAQAALAQGDAATAFELWNREIRLRRFLGTSAELEALLRVGSIAWQQENFYQAQVMTQRLRQLQAEQLEERETPNVEVLQRLAQAYEEVGARQAALDLLERVLAIARDRNDPITEEETLRQIARIALQDLDYEEAAAAYRELREMAVSRGDRLSEAYYLTQLAYIYDQLRRYEDAIAVKQELETYYRTLNDIAKVTALKLAIGDDYAAIGQLNAAVTQFQDAYRLAWEALQFYRAQEALDRLALLYERYNEFDAALQVYRTQLDVHQLARDTYGLMVTYDRIGKLQQRRQNYGPALEAFRRGLELARQLGNREAYFQVNIETVMQEMSAPNLQ
ncbi:tetratricopeptide repeat protein [Baaleninema simplex]|uniref:tetratricopeptide repeat protein n=1 Tax=Baaleninema simplex TaxID=2862350 RepID=UPI0003730596|nr:tetratricopeptide repeat protein [Baaleninema simplex]